MSSSFVQSIGCASIQSEEIKDIKRTTHLHDTGMFQSQYQFTTEIIQNMSNISKSVTPSSICPKILKE